MLLLHLSDIHFRAGEAGSAMDPNKHLRASLLQDAAEHCARLGEAPAAILITGDIAFAGLTDEYTFALSWLEKLALACKTTTASIFIVPGNHDVVRATAGKRAIQAIHHQIKSTDPALLDPTLSGFLTDEETGRMLYSSIDPYNLFAQQFFCDVAAPERTIAKRDLELNDGSILRLYGLNSALISSSTDKPGDIFVDPACFQVTREYGVENAILCHHPFSWIRNGDLLKDHLNDVSCIQLFGHEHTNRIELQRGLVRVAASAAHPDRTEHGWEPGYNIIDLKVTNLDGVRCLDISTHVRIWQTRPGQFRPKMDGQSDVFSWKINLSEWTAPVATTAHERSTKIDDLEESPTLVNAAKELESDIMDKLREISVRFFKLTFSQKSAIAGKLGLLEDEDMNQPDFERFRRVFLRARDRGLVEELEREVSSCASDETNKT